jgi:Cytochrome C oxidase, cbb3-type, subunit III
MTAISRRRVWTAALVVVGSATFGFAQTGPLRNGADLYQSACAACHGADGSGAARTTVGFETRLPDFSDCAFSTAEPDVDWISTVHVGGRVRGLDRNMPAFGDALSSDEIERVVAYVRGFCTSRSWPIGNLNLPRALVTEKAFPENEVLITTTVPTQYTDRVGTRFTYERRVGPLSQFEVTMPFNVVKWPGGWNSGLGDIDLGFKQVVVHDANIGTIVSGGVELTFPTGKETEGLGNRLLTIEPFAVFSQSLPFNAFLHAQVGMDVPLNNQAALNEVFWRAAVGKTFTEPKWGRAWSPIVELLGSRDLGDFGERPKWDLLPELLVTLSRRQHVMASCGVRVPLSIRSRSRAVMASLLWEWSQGSMFSGW